MSRVIAALTIVMIPLSTVPRFAGAELQVAAGNCVPTLDGAAFPFLIPDYIVWEGFFERVQMGDVSTRRQELMGQFQLSESAVTAAATVGAAALKRAAVLRSAPIDPGGSLPDTLASDVILEARDDLFRAASRTDLDRMAELMETRRRELRYRFPKQGTRASETAIVRCPVSVNGKEHPHLIPETFYWEFHFRILASMSSRYRTGPESFEEDYLSSLRELLRIPDADIVRLLLHASSTVVTLDAIRSSPGQEHGAQDAEVAVASAVRNARIELIRSLPKSSWAAIDRHAKSRRGGIVYDFPTGL